MRLRRRITEASTAIVTAMAMLSLGAEAKAQAYIPSVTIPEQLLYDLQIELQLTEIQAGGIVGNLAQETGNFRRIQEMDPLIEGSHGGLGYAQWTASRRKAFIAWADGRDTRSYEVNLGYLLHELREDYPDLIMAMRQQTDLDAATRLFMAEYLRPSKAHANLAARIGYARDYLNEQFGEAGCLSHMEVIMLWGKEALEICPIDLADLRPQPRPENLAQDAAAARPSENEQSTAGQKQFAALRTLVEQMLAEADLPVLDPFAARRATAAAQPRG